MLVSVALQAYQISGNCDCFFLQDVSCCYDCGGCMENVQGYTKWDVTKTIIKITFPNGAVYTIDKGWLPTMADLKLCASDFNSDTYISGETPLPTDCGCDNTPALFPVNPTIPINPLVPNTEGQLAGLPDGCYIIEYEVYAMEKVHQYLCNYEIALTGLITGYTIDLLISDVWVDYTANFEYDELGGATLDLEDVEMVITEYRIMNGDTVVEQGDIEGVCSDNFINTDEEILIGSSIHQTVFLCHIQDALAGAIRKVVIKNNKCNNCLKNVTEKEAVSLLAVAVAKLAATSTGCNCKCIDDTIKSVSDIIKNVIGEC